MSFFEELDELVDVEPRGCWAGTCCSYVHGTFC